MNPLKREEMNDEQRATYDLVVARGGRLGGPNGIYCRVPELFLLNQEVGNYLRDNSVSPRHRQIAVITACRYFEAAYPWGVQARAALNLGIEREVVEAINRGETPKLSGDDMAVYELTNELVRHGGLSDASFAKAEKTFGFNRLMDLVATVGFYTSVALIANVFEVDVPNDIPIPLAR
jgi:4-carboxymuconolactone decarboxylase